MKINLFKNAKQEPQILYCRHIAQGVCGYQDETIFIGEDALKKMDQTFAGKPLYVEHQDVNLEKLQEQADGYVIESFYLPEDASHWAKIIVVSDKGHEAVSKGWAVSNAYVPDAFGANGEWHNIPYQREITEGHYTHLAIVPNPRYEEAVIMTPEEFKQYKAGKKEQLNQLQNSKKEGEKQQMSMLKLFTKKAVENSDDISNAMVELSNGKTVSIKEMINACEADIKAKESAKAKKNEEEELLEKVVKVNGEDVAVKDLIKSYEAKNKCNEDEEDKEEKKAKKNEEEDEKKAKKNKANEGEDKEEKDNEDVDKRKLIDEVGGFLKDKGLSDEDIRFVIKKMEKESYDKSSSGSKDNEDEDKKEEKKDKKNSKDFLKLLKEAEELENSKGEETVVADTMDQKIARGAARYGSGK